MFVNDSPNGEGTCQFTNQVRYQGGYKDNYFNGKGRTLRKDGLEYEGEWEKEVIKD